MEERPPEAPPPPDTPILPPAPGPLPPLAPHQRLPLRGKMESPTQAPSAAERMARLARLQRARRRRGFMLGLLVGQLLILAVDFGGEALLRALAHKVVFNPPIHYRAVVFLGMTGGIAATGLFIAIVLGFQGLGYVFGKKGVGLGTALGRGFRRVGKAVVSLGLTLAVVGGTAWFLIPKPEWPRTKNWMVQKGNVAWQWGKGLVTPAPKPR